MKKAFTLIELMLVVAIIAILAMIAVPLYQHYITRSHNSAVHSLLQQLALAQAACQVEHKVGSAAPEFIFVTTVSDVDKVEKLSEFGFRPDDRVAFVVMPPRSGANGFVAFAAFSATHSQLYTYDDVAFSGVRECQPGQVYGADVPTELPLFTIGYGASNPIIASGRVHVDLATCLVDAFIP